MIPRQTVFDLAQDPWQRFVHRHYFAIHILTCGGLAVIDPLLPCFVLAWPSVLAFHLAGAVNVLCHDANGSKNHRWLNWLAVGDALHGNHHDHPAHFSNSQGRPGEFDLSGILIRTFLLKKNVSAPT